MQKILVADDSTTIQKVIKMTLEDRDYDLLVALSEDEMMERVDESIDLLLLDFTLSSDKSGIELVEKLHSQYSSLKVVALLSTFDQVDKSALTSNGFYDSVTKPFDSNSFLELIENTLDNSNEDISQESIDEDSQADTISEDTKEIIPEELEAQKAEGVVQEEELVDQEEELVEQEKECSDEIISPSEEKLDEWTVSEEKPTESVDSQSTKVDLEKISASDLDSVVEDWGIEVPSGVNSTQSFAAIPPIIEESSEREIKAEEDNMVDGSKIPDSDDLEYPDMTTPIEQSSEEESEENLTFVEETTSDELDALNTSSTPISLDTLSDIVEDEQDDDSTDPNIELSNYEGNLDKLVSDETEGDDLWSVDDGLKVENISPINMDDEYSPHLEAVEEESDLEAPQEDTMINAAVDETIQTALNSFNRDDFLVEVKDELKREMLNNSEFVDSLRADVVSFLAADEQFRTELKASFVAEIKGDLQKISWEVIPDLAENLIRDEIKSISNNL